MSPPWLRHADARRLRALAGATFAAALAGFALLSATSFASGPVVSGTSVTAAPDSGTTALPGFSVSGYTNPSQDLLVSISTTLGTVSLGETNGLTLSYGYSTFTNTSGVQFTGTQTDVATALATLSLTGAGTIGTAAIQVTVTADPGGAVAYLPATGHYYEYVSDPGLDWTQAKADAQAATFAGQSGYLATLPNTTVNTFINDHLNGAQDVWAGGASVDYPSGYNGDTNVERVWTWQGGPLQGTIFTECSNVPASCSFVNDTVPAGTFTDWSSGEPNNSGYPSSGDPGEHYLEINENGNLHWNDFSNTNNGTSGYVVEFGNLPTGGAFTGVYSTTSDVALAVAPGAPSNVSATPGGDSATVTWQAPAADGGAPITSYTVTAEPGGETCTTSTTSCVVHGLTDGTAYKFTVTAANGAGAATSAASLSVTPTSPAGAPTDVTAEGGNAVTTVSWVAPSDDGGAAITGYVVTAEPGDNLCQTTTTSCVLPGLANGAGYTFTVTAINAAGAGAPATVIATMRGAFSIVRSRAGADGTIAVVLLLPGAGTLSVIGTHSDPKSVASAAQSQLEPGYHRFVYAPDVTMAVTRAGYLALALHPSPAGRRLLRRHARYGLALNVRIWISYTPAGGAIRTIPYTVTVLTGKR
jgi:hypothetical protein